MWFVYENWRGRMDPWGKLCVCEAYFPPLCTATWNPEDKGAGGEEMRPGRAAGQAAGQRGACDIHLFTPLTTLSFIP